MDGEKASFSVGTKGDTNVYSIVPKSSNGWKLGMGLDTKRPFQKIYNDIAIYVYQYKSTDDYYITVTDTNGGSLDITDNRKSKFKYLEKSNSTLNKTFYTYYAYINGFDDQYAITVNGKQIKI